MASIDFEHVTKRYADGVEAVTDMNLAIADGEFMILVGPSGSGKSTALRMLEVLPVESSGAPATGERCHPFVIATPPPGREGEKSS